MEEELRGAIWADGIATFIHDAMGDMMGATVVIADVDPDTWNGTFTVVACTSRTCSVDMAEDPGAYVGGGTITKEGD